MDSRFLIVRRFMKAARILQMKGFIAGVVLKGIGICGIGPDGIINQTVTFAHFESYFTPLITLFRRDFSINFAVLFGCFVIFSPGELLVGFSQFNLIARYDAENQYKK